MKKIIYILLFVFVAIQASAQNADIEFKIKNFPKKKKGFEKALADLKAGDVFYSEGIKGVYSLCEKAIPFYLAAHSFNPDNAELNHKIGMCYYLNENGPQALFYFRAAIKLNSEIYPEDLLYLAECYHADLQWAKALEMFRKYRDEHDGKSSVSTPLGICDIEKRIRECVSGKLLSLQPPKCIIRKLENPLNSDFGEDCPVISSDGRELYFASERGTIVATDSGSITLNTGEDIYFSQKHDGIWGDPQKMSLGFSGSVNERPASISPDGRTAILFIDVHGGDLYESKRSEIGWELPKPFPETVNSEFKESYGSYSFDGKRIYFISNRPGGFGGSDIWFTQKDDKGNWAPAQNAGDLLNTDYDEDGVFLHPDGKTLYFSSKGHNSVGGYDLFKSVLLNNEKEKPQNLGLPINSPADERYLSISANGLKGIFASIRNAESRFPDLYEVTFKGFEREPVLISQNKPLVFADYLTYSEFRAEEICTNCSEMYAAKGIILDKKSGKPLEAMIEVTDIENNKIIYVSESDAKTGQYLLNLPSGKNYGIFVKAFGYLPHSQNLIVPATAKYSEKEIDMRLSPSKEDETEILNCVKFEFRSKVLAKSSLAELERLNKFLTSNPKLRIEVSCYTDESDDPQQNMKLCEERMRGITDRLSKYGTESRRLNRAELDVEKFMCGPEDRKNAKAVQVTQFKLVQK